MIDFCPIIRDYKSDFKSCISLYILSSLVNDERLKSAFEYCNNTSKADHPKWIEKIYRRYILSYCTSCPYARGCQWYLSVRRLDQ